MDGEVRRRTKTATRLLLGHHVQLVPRLFFWTLSHQLQVIVASQPRVENLEALGAINGLILLLNKQVDVLDLLKIRETRDSSTYALILRWNTQKY